MAGGVPSRMAMAPMLEAALALRARGYAVHWLRPRSKIPIQKGWSTAEVMSLEALRRSYRCRSLGSGMRGEEGPWAVHGQGGS
jgi:hypothetical protein